MLDKTTKATPEKEQGNASKGRRLPPEFGELNKAIVLFQIGPKELSVHKDLACHFSPFLSAAFTGSFKEGRTQTMKLEDTTESAFALFVCWIYTGKLDDRANNPPNSQIDLLDLGLLADKFLMPEMQNDAIQEAYKLAVRTNAVPASIAVKIYENTLKGHPLRRLIAEMCALCLDADFIETCSYTTIETFPQEMLYDMVIAARKRLGNVALKDLNIKNFMVDVPEDNGEKAAGRKAP